MAADPKFQNLPGIAYDQPDVYETPDIPESNEPEYYQEEAENEAIERMHISAIDSYRKFRGKWVDSKVDFSDRIGRRPNRGYDACTVYELAGPDEKETPVQKCSRLQCEMNELLDEVAVLQEQRDIAEEEKRSYDAVTTVMATAKKVLESLKLEQVLGNEGPHKEEEIKLLINQVEEFKKSGILTAVPAPSTDIAESSRLAKLEYRLTQLEKTLGAQPERLSRLTVLTNTSNIMEAVRHLSTRAAMLDTGKLDTIEARLTALVGKMDTVAKKASGSEQEAIRDQKILELYDIAKQTEPVTAIIPTIIDRMQSLEALHTYAMNFAKIIAEIEQKQGTIATSIAGNKELLHAVQETFESNLETMKKRVDKMEQRVVAVEAAK